MREILFRGKNSNSNKWVYGYYMQSVAENPDSVDMIISSDCASGWRIDKDTAGQYTGLQDKNGAKIFEGDIISANLDDENPENTTNLAVVWKEYGFLGRHLQKPYIYYYESLENKFVKKFEVIGNIYDNPELLTNESE